MVITLVWAVIEAPVAQSVFLPSLTLQWTVNCRFSVVISSRGLVLHSGHLSIDPFLAFEWSWHLSCWKLHGYLLAFGAAKSVQVKLPVLTRPGRTWTWNPLTLRVAWPVRHILVKDRRVIRTSITAHIYHHTKDKWLISNSVPPGIEVFISCSWMRTESSYWQFSE